MTKTLVLSLSLLLTAMAPVLSRAAWNADGNPASAVVGSDRYAGIACSDGFQGVIVPWFQVNGGKIVFAQRFTESGDALWSSGGTQISLTSYWLPVVAPDGAGGAYVSLGYLDVLLQHLSPIGEVLWPEAVPLCSAPGEQSGSLIIPDGSGGAIVAWTDNRTIPSDVYAQRVNAIGQVQWAANGIPVSNTSQMEALWSMLPDGNGGAFVAYDRQNDVFVQRINGDGVAQWPAGGVPISLADNEQDRPRIAPDGAGGIIATWDDIRSNSHYDVYAQRINAGGIPQWTIDGVLVKTGANGNGPNSPAIVSDGTAGAIIAWRDGDGLYGPGVVRAQKVNASGALQWPGAGGVTVTDYGVEPPIVIASDGAGGAFMAWRGNPSIRAMHLSAAGALLWPYNGMPVGNPNHSGGYPSIVRSGDGAIVTWSGSTDGFNGIIYALRIGGTAAGIRNSPRPASLILGDFMPNPFSTSTTIDITLNRASTVSIEVFDAAGRRVRHINTGMAHTGTSRLGFDGVDDQAHPLPSGVYFYRIHAGAETVTRKMVIAR